MNALMRSIWWLAPALPGLGCSAFCAEPPAIIFDTDMGGDCDDVGALFMLHGALGRSEVNLLATIGCTSSATIAPALDAINTWFGRPEIPVGTLKDAGFKESKSFTDELARRYPHRYPASKDYPDAVALYRKTLASQPDHSVIITAVGPLRNIANLLKSGPDVASPLDGRALAAAKVRRLDVMGGKYPPQESRNENDIEYNFMTDAEAAALVCSEWPTPVLFNGEGGSTNSGRRVTFELPEHNPLTMAYTSYPGVGYAGDRLSWDPVSVLVSLRGPEPWYREVPGGRNVADGRTGRNRWQPGTDSGHSYLVLDTKRPKHEVETALEDLMAAGKGRPQHLKFDTASYGIKGGTCQFTGSAGNEARNVFDGDDRTVWTAKAASSWLQCRYAEGRRYSVTSYAVVAPEKSRLPKSLTLSGSNDEGATWTVVDHQATPAFPSPRQEFTIASPAKHNLYRLQVTAANAAEGVQISTLELIESIHCNPDIAVSSLSLDHRTLRVPVHQRATLNATLAPRDTREREVTWTSSDVTIADVRRIGEQCAVVAGKKSGSATVTASIGGIQQAVEITVTRSTLPEGWQFDEPGAPAMPGAVSVNDGSFRITGCGHAMTAFWERVRDQGAIVSRPADGDGEISARLVSLAPNTGGPAYQWDSRPPAAAGLMLRESLSEPLSRYVLIQVEATGKLVARWRDKTGDQDDNQKADLGPVTLPLHLSIVRTGNTIHLFTSADRDKGGKPRFTRTTTMGPQTRAGLFICSGNPFATSTAEFDNVSCKE